MHKDYVHALRFDSVSTIIYFNLFGLSYEKTYYDQTYIEVDE